MTKKQWFWRILFYLTGMVVMAFGVVLCTNANLGISCMTSFPFAVSKASGINFSVALFGFYMLTMLAQIVLIGREFKLRDLFQLPFSVAFSLLVDGFETVMQFHFDLLWQNLLLLLLSLLCMASGVSLMINMKFVPNPADGMTYCFSKRMRMSLGLAKNILDISFVILSAATDLIFSGTVTSGGIGTVCAAVLMGRFVALIDWLFKARMLRMAGLAQTPA